MRTVLILNPTSGSSMMAANQQGTLEDDEAFIINLLHTYDIKPEVWHTTPEDPGDRLAKRAAAQGTALVIAAGGDGTIHAVASGLVGSKSMLGIIAMGTMNNLAHSLSIPTDIEKACEIIAQGHTKLIDMGQINGHVFLEVAGVGLEAVLFPAAEEIKRSSWLSTIHGVIAGLMTLFTFRPSKLKIAFDNHRGRRYEALQVTVCNAPYYGVHLQVAPRILIDDGLLDVVIYQHFSKLEYIRHAISICQGRHTLQPKIRHRKAKALYITSDLPVEIHADGLPHGYTPAEITITPGVLRVCVPEQVIAGPNVADSALKQTERYQQIANDNRLLEKK